MMTPNEIIALAIMQRFNSLIGGELLCSPLVYAAASQVLETLATHPDPLSALAEVEELEATWRR